MNSELKKGKRIYYKNRINVAKNSIKKKWDIINQILGKTDNRILPPPLEKTDGSLSTQKDMANHLNIFFSEIASKLASTIPNTNIGPLHALFDSAK